MNDAHATLVEGLTLLCHALGVFYLIIIALEKKK